MSTEAFEHVAAVMFYSNWAQDGCFLYVVGRSLVYSVDIHVGEGVLTKRVCDEGDLDLSHDSL